MSNGDYIEIAFQFMSFKHTNEVWEIPEGERGLVYICLHINVTDKRIRNLE